MRLPFPSLQASNSEGIWQQLCDVDFGCCEGGGPVDLVSSICSQQG